MGVGTAPTAANLWLAAVAASAPSEEGAGAPKGFRGATEGERTFGCCLHKSVGAHKVIQVSLLFSVRLCLLLSHSFCVSLLPSRRFNPCCAVPPPSSEGGEGAPAPRTEINCFGKEDSNERNPSGVSFVFVQVAFACKGEARALPRHAQSLPRFAPYHINNQCPAFSRTKRAAHSTFAVRGNISTG